MPRPSGHLYLPFLKSLQEARPPLPLRPLPLRRSLPCLSHSRAACRYPAAHRAGIAGYRMIHGLGRMSNGRFPAKRKGSARGEWTAPQALRSIVYCYPAPGFRRPLHGVANAFHAIPFRKAGRRLLAFHHRFDKLVGFDGFQFAVPDVHPGNVPGHFPVEMRGAGVDRLKAPSLVGVAGQAHLQLVEPLVVEVEVAHRTVELPR